MDRIEQIATYINARLSKNKYSVPGVGICNWGINDIPLAGRAYFATENFCCIDNEYILMNSFQRKIEVLDDEMRFNLMLVLSDEEFEWYCVAVVISKIINTDKTVVCNINKINQLINDEISLYEIRQF